MKTKKGRSSPGELRPGVDGGRGGERRLHRGLSQAALAKLARCAANSVARIERGESGGAGLRRDLAAALGVEPEAISLEAP